MNICHRCGRAIGSDGCPDCDRLPIFGDLAPGDVFRFGAHGHDWRKLDGDRAIRWADRGGICTVDPDRPVYPYPETECPR